MGKTKIKPIEEDTTGNTEQIQEEKEKLPKEKKSKAGKKTGQPKVRSKKYQNKVKDFDKSKKYPVLEAVELAQKGSYTRFPSSLEIHINTNSKNIRGLITLPHLSGKQIKVLVFGPSTHSISTQGRTEWNRSTTSLRTSPSAGLEFDDSVIFGDDQTIDTISKGKLDFDTVVTTPEWMPKLARVAKILGPRGLMPNPKNGTITTDLNKTVTELQGGKTEYKTESNGQVIHMVVGKVDQAKEEVAANIKALYNVLGRSKIKKITLSPTMGPGVKIEIGSI